MLKKKRKTEEILIKAEAADMDAVKIKKPEKKIAKAAEKSQKRLERAQRRAGRAKKREPMIAMLNKYSAFFHVLLACGVCFLIEWISRHSFLEACGFVVDRNLVFLYNSLIVYSSLMLAYIVKRRISMRLSICAFWLFLGTINGCILAKRVSPFSYTDLKMVGDLLTMQSNYFTATEAARVIACVSVVVLFLIVFWFRGPKYKGRTHRIAGVFLTVAVVLMIPNVTNAAVSNNILTSYFTNLAQGYKDYGFVYSFSSSVLDRGMSTPDNYSEEAVNEVLAKIYGTADAEDADDAKENDSSAAEQQASGAKESFADNLTVDVDGGEASGTLSCDTFSAALVKEQSAKTASDGIGSSDTGDVVQAEDGSPTETGETPAAEDGPTETGETPAAEDGQIETDETSAAEGDLTETDETPAAGDGLTETDETPAAEDDLTEADETPVAEDGLTGVGEDSGGQTENTDSEETIPEETEESDEEYPNIICILLESFVDPEEILFLETSEDAVPNFRYLYENYSSGYLEVPVVGAGTANTEFEVLTGMSMQFFGLGEIPYKTILKQTDCESIASDLSTLGYGTHVVHNNGGNFYSRANAFSMMGFDTFTCKELMDIHEYTPTGDWATDHILIGEVEKSLDYTSDSTDFVYVITVGSHGDYPTYQVLEDPEITISGVEDESSAYAWEYYVNMLHQVDEFIGDLIEMLEARDEKTLVVMFGDHLPTMGLTEEDMASGSLFLTKYASWNNFGMEKTDADMTSYQFLAEVLDWLDIHTGTMFTFQQNRDVFETEEEYQSAMELLQYDILYGERYVYGGEDAYPATDIVMGTQEVVIDRLIEGESGKYLYIIGDNFTKWSRVYVDDTKISTTYISSKLLRVKLSKIEEGTHSIVVSQVGSSETRFRDSNEVFYTKVTEE